MRMIVNAICLYIAMQSIAGCTTNEFLIGAWYAQRDDKMVKFFSAYADFDKHQRRWINNAAAEYHAWHRKTQLPLYSLLLKTIKDDINADKALKKAQVENWAWEINSLAAVAMACHPLNYAVDFLGSLTDQQVAQIGKTIWKKAEETKEAHSRKRFDNIVKWGQRIGLQFDPQQRSIIRNTLVREMRSNQQKSIILRDWKNDFLYKLEHREAVDFEFSMQNHISRLWKLSELSYPDESQYNHALWIDAAHEVFMLQAPRQREKFSIWLNDMAIVLKSLSSKTVENSAGSMTRWTEECRP